MRTHVDRLPFDWKNPVGYLVAVFCQSALLLNPVRYMACMLTLVLATCILLLALIKEGVGVLRKINDNAKRPRSQQQQQQHTLELLADFIRMHTDAKQLSDIRKHI